MVILITTRNSTANILHEMTRNGNSFLTTQGNESILLPSAF